MKRRELQRSGRPASDLLEEAVRLLRSAPPSAWLAYYLGTVPCMLGALYFLSDMSRSAYAAERLVQSSVAMGTVWLWMKCCQAVFTCRLRSELLLLDPPRWTPGRLARLAVAQIALQPIGLIVRPLALQLVIPYIWTATFFQNVTVFGDGGHGGLWALCRRAFAQCVRWPLQMHMAAALLHVFGFFVWLNIVIAMFLAPQLGKMFSGIETQFTQNPMGLINPTFFAATFAALYLCLDPLRKAVNVLRCFYGSSLRTGEDLEVQLKAVRRTATLAAGVLLFLGTLAPVPARAAMREEPKVSSTELSQSLDDVLERREYAWRAPRDLSAVPEDKSWFGKLRKDFAAWVENTVNKTKRWFGRMMRKVSDWLFPDKEFTPRDGSGFLSWFSNVRVITILLLVVAAIVLIVLITRRRLPVKAAEAEPVAPLPDLNEEHITADQLPEDGWLALARDLMQSGQLRLALRASYLASLAHLGHRDFIRLARHKSNRDYDRELQRRARANTDLLTAFDRNLTAFERAWYGEHEVTSETLGDFSQNLERIRAC
jgi:Domain of unknown function (DUF4129)